MLDFNHKAKFYEQVNGCIDMALEKASKQEPARNYLGDSRFGVECKCALQFEYMNTQKDEGLDFNGQTLRIFVF